MDAGRVVTLAVLDDAGSDLGTLPPFEVALPYWQEVGDLVAAARERYGVDLTILRLVTTEPGRTFGGAVTYLAQASELPARYRGPVDVDTGPHPHRAPYAEVGGPATSLRWASEALEAAGRGPVLVASQRRTWNLSTLWRLRTGTGEFWLKQVPWFFAHEATVLRLVAAHGPTLVAGDGGRMLLEHIDGQDLYDTDGDTRDAIAADMHQIQTSVDGATALATGAPDRRAAGLVDLLSGVVEAHGSERARKLAADLPDRVARLNGCGLPATLAHGDLHPGNVLGDATTGRRVIIDWGDSFVGSPAFDILRLVGDLPPDALVGRWAARWRASVPGCDPLAAVAEARPLAALLGAAIYQRFLDNIEPAEHPYHVADVPRELARAEDLLAQTGGA